MQRQRWRQPFAEHLSEAAVGQAGGDVIVRRLDQSEPGPAGGDVGIGVVDADPAAHRQRAQAPVDPELEVEGTPAGRRLVVHREVPAEFGELPRMAMTLQVGSAGAGHLRQLGQVPADQAGIVQLADPQHAVRTLAQQVDQAIVAAQLQLQFRVTLAELRQERNHPHPPQCARQVDPQAPARVVQDAWKAAFRLLQVRQQAHATLVVGLPVQGQADLAGGALQQLHAKVRLQLLDRLGHAGARQLQAVRGLAEGAQLDDAGEGLHGLETIHRTPSIIWKIRMVKP